MKGYMKMSKAGKGDAEKEGFHGCKILRHGLGITKIGELLKVAKKSRLIS